MTKLGATLKCLAALTLLTVCAPGVRAAALEGGHPSITITNLHDGSVVYGSTVTVNVSVSNFKLVKPVYINPPKLQGNQGHIHYVLDGLANFKPTRDASVNLSHTWTGVAPGRHTVVVYLATSQHAQFAGARQASATITVMKAAAPAGGSTPASSAAASGKATVASAPRSGGAHEARPVPVALVAPGVVALLAGAVLLGMTRRRTAAVASTR